MFSTKPKSLGDILSTFTKTITELELLQKQNSESIATKSENVVKLNTEIEAHKAESAQAGTVLKNLNAILNQ